MPAFNLLEELIAITPLRSGCIRARKSEEMIERYTPKMAAEPSYAQPKFNPAVLTQSVRVYQPARV